MESTHQYLTKSTRKDLRRGVHECPQLSFKFCGYKFFCGSLARQAVYATLHRHRIGKANSPHYHSCMDDYKNTENQTAEMPE
jgi:hypothetical protein